MSVILVSLSKTAEPSEMPFGLRTAGGPMEPYIRWVQIPMGRGNFFGKGAPIVKSGSGHSAVTCANTAEPIVMPFGLWAQNGPRNHELDGVPDPP